MTDSMPPDTQRTGIHESPSAPPNDMLSDDIVRHMMRRMPADVAHVRDTVESMRDLLREHMSADSEYRSSIARWVIVALVGSALAILVASSSLAVSIMHQQSAPVCSDR